MREAARSLSPMSKAFLRESDLPDIPEPPRRIASLPPGTTNYITAGGAERLRRELAQLSEVERPALAIAAAAGDTDGKQELQRLDQRIRQLQQSLRSAEIIQPATGTSDQVRFGTTVTVRDAAGVESRYRLVGVDETDLERNWVSWLSPIAQALLNARVGDQVTFNAPSGKNGLKVIAIAQE
jgi:transcription elongation factor GreB